MDNRLLITTWLAAPDEETIKANAAPLYLDHLMTYPSPGLGILPFWTLSWNSLAIINWYIPLQQFCFGKENDWNHIALHLSPNIFFYSLNESYFENVTGMEWPYIAPPQLAIDAFKHDWCPLTLCLLVFPIQLPTFKFRVNVHQCVNPGNICKSIDCDPVEVKISVWITDHRFL